MKSHGDFKWLLFSFCFFFSTILFAEITQDDFTDSFNRFYHGQPIETLETERVPSNNTVFILVKGFGGDEKPLASFYFWSLRKELERLTKETHSSNQNTKRVFTLTGDSKLGFAPNAEKLQAEIESILNQIPKSSKIYLVGHSKGAVESWTALMNSPHIAHERLAGALFLQGPFQGSPLADFVMAGKQAADIEPFSQSPFQYTARSFLLKRGAPEQYKAAIQQMTTQAATAHVEQVLETNHNKIAPDFWNKTLFLWTNHNQPTLTQYIYPPNTLFMDICHKALTKISGTHKSDGYVLTPSAGLPPQLEARKIVLDGFHHGSFDLGNAPKSLARTLVHLLK